MERSSDVSDFEWFIQNPPDGVNDDVITLQFRSIVRRSDFHDALQ